jgi:hypothetical protein
MPTPLDSFVTQLPKPHSPEKAKADAPPACSLPAHTHTLDGFSNGGARMECETKCEGSLTLSHPPLQAGWLVVYRDRAGKLRGAADEREHGTVKECRRQGAGWVVMLTSGEHLSLSIIRAVGQTSEREELQAAWSVREHGYDGQGKLPRGR